MAHSQLVEVPVRGMDCAGCTRSVQQAIAELPGVESVEVLLSAEKAVIRLDPERVPPGMIREAVQKAGYQVPEADGDRATALQADGANLSRTVLQLFGLVFGAVLLIVVAGEWFGLFDSLTARVPWPLGVGLVLLAGYPVFVNVIRASLRGKVISHTLMSLGVLAALAVGEWATAAIVVFFMRVGDFTESFTTEKARGALKSLTALAPQTARVERDAVEQEVPIAEVRVGETVIVRPGEKIPVDGEVLAGHATVDQAAITGESMPVEAGPGARVFAATIATLGSLRVRVTQVGADTTFGRVIKLVEEAEAHRGDVQRLADRFSTYFLPFVAVIAALTFLLSRDPLATAAVLVVACSCSLALATPIALLASIGAGAKQGLLIKGGKYLEILPRADVLLVDKTGTLTLGQPRITDVVALDGLSENALLTLTASAERYSEHPLAAAVRREASARALQLVEPEGFEAVPGTGIRATVGGQAIAVGSRRLLSLPPEHGIARELERQGKTLLWVTRDGLAVGLLAATDTVRPEVPAALQAVQRLGVRRIELLTGDNERTAAALAEQLGIAYRANLLPEEKIAIVKEYQARGHTVVMVGDGVNDAPALAQADVGIAMGAAGTDIAMEAAHVIVMREDWSLIPELFQLARRTMGVVKVNLGFTALYNVVGLTLAAFGFLPPILAAAAQSLPDLGILANSSRLIRQGKQQPAVDLHAVSGE